MTVTRILAFLFGQLECVMHELDACGLPCPLPLLKAKQALNRMHDGETLLVRATDPGSARDFQVFCRQAGHALEALTAEAGIFSYRICKGRLAGN